MAIIPVTRANHLLGFIGLLRSIGRLWGQSQVPESADKNGVVCRFDLRKIAITLKAVPRRLSTSGRPTVPFSFGKDLSLRQHWIRNGYGRISRPGRRSEELMRATHYVPHSKIYLSLWHLTLTPQLFSPRNPPKEGDVSTVCQSFNEYTDLNHRLTEGGTMEP